MLAAQQAFDAARDDPTRTKMAEAYRKAQRARYDYNMRHDPNSRANQANRRQYQQKTPHVCSMCAHGQEGQGRSCGARLVCAGRLEGVGGLPVGMWAQILEVRAILLLQAVFRSHRVRHGPLRYLRMYVSKGWLPANRACYWAVEMQRRGVPHVHTMVAGL